MKYNLKNIITVKIAIKPRHQAIKNLEWIFTLIMKCSIIITLQNPEYLNNVLLLCTNLVPLFYGIRTKQRPSLTITEIIKNSTFLKRHFSAITISQGPFLDFYLHCQSWWKKAMPIKIDKSTLRNGIKLM